MNVFIVMINIDLSQEVALRQVLQTIFLGNSLLELTLCWQLEDATSAATFLVEAAALRRLA